MTKSSHTRAALLAVLLVTITGLLAAPAASASPILHAQTFVAAIANPAARLVGPNSTIAAVQRRERAPNYDSSATGSSVAAEGEGTAELTYDEHILDNMAARGWTEESIDATVANPAETHDVWDLTGGGREPATAYENSAGAYVVVNDETNAVVQISDANDPDWKPVWDSPRFQR